MTDTPAFRDSALRRRADEAAHAHPATVLVLTALLTLGLRLL